MVGFDLETSGLEVETAAIVAACVGVAGRNGWSARNWLLTQAEPIPQPAIDVHGITTEYANEHGTDPAVSLPEIVADLYRGWESGMPVVGHNISYDLTTLDRNLRRHGLAPLEVRGPVLDTLILFRRLDWSTGSRTLSKLAERHGITFPAHDAEADALASLRLLHIIAGDSELLPYVPLDALQGMQARWHIAQQERAAARAAGNGTPFTPALGWPVADRTAA